MQFMLIIRGGLCRVSQSGLLLGSSNGLIISRKPCYDDISNIGSFTATHLNPDQTPNRI